MRPRLRPRRRPRRALPALALLAWRGGAAGSSQVEPLASADDAGTCPTVARPADALAGKRDVELFGRYLEACRSMQVRPSADALVGLQLGSERLTLRQPFGDLELRALVMLLEDDDGAKLRGLRHLDLSGCSLGPAGMLLISHVLRHPQCGLEYLDLSHQGVDRESVCSVASAVGQSQSLRVLRMDSCDLGDGGGQIVIDLVANKSSTNPLKEIDIQNNFISFDMCSQISKVAHETGVRVHLAGNRVLDEVFNSVSHGFGEVLAVIGTVTLAKRAGYDRPHYQVWSIAMYCSALNIMYLSSTLYHSFFALGRTTVYIFGILDYSGIFLLIAGSYSPFLGVALYEEWWAALLLAMMWTCALVGVFTAAFYTGPHAIVLRLSLYITMGWAILVCIRPLARKLGGYGTFLLFLGGVCYTGGVPFFVRGRHTLGIPDHTIWHLFVVGGSIAHYICVYKYVLHGKARSAPPSDTDEYMSAPTGRPAEAVPLQPL